ncbi:hypothetical protein GDO81_002361 [Engystomops pustulosus]|uniref:THAP-type domain-containing protein n=1 Tax=Engystomops pustulosus TaxID=76066 RepID=A0AAV7DKK8_ENGPU|nr:hypothetical protein GDO81_002361 [Engystomops pustulosus]
MPVCLINGCTYTPGRHRNGFEIKLHTFPNSLERIKDWLLQMGQNFNDVDNVAQQILDSKLKKSNKYRLCSLHFTDDSFIVNVNGRILRPNALPSIFQTPGDPQEKIHEDLSLRKSFKRKRGEKTLLETSYEKTLRKASYEKALNQAGFEKTLQQASYEKTSQQNSCGKTLHQASSEKNLHQTTLEKTASDEDSLHQASIQKTSHETNFEETSPETNMHFIEPSESPPLEIIPVTIKTEDPDDFPLHTMSVESPSGSCESVNENVKEKVCQDAETQTEFTFKNSIIYLLDNDFLTGNPAIDPCGPPYFSLQNPIVALNCTFIPNFGRPS